MIASYPDHVWVFLHEFRNLEGARLISSARAEGHSSDRSSGSSSKASRRGEFEIENTRLAALGWLGLHNYIYIWHHADGPFCAALIAENFADFFIRGVMARPSSPPDPTDAVGQAGSGERRSEPLRRWRRMELGGDEWPVEQVPGRRISSDERSGIELLGESRQPPERFRERAR